MIIIKKDDVGNLKLYIKDCNEPVIIIYVDSKKGIMGDMILFDQEDANELAQAVSLAGMYLQCVQTDEKDVNKKNIDVVYVNTIMSEEKTSKYSARLFLERLYSDNIVTINRKTRIRMEFKTFYHKDGKIHINYKPVVW